MKREINQQRKYLNSDNYDISEKFRFTIHTFERYLE